MNIKQEAINQYELKLKKDAKFKADMDYRAQTNVYDYLIKLLPALKRGENRDLFYLDGYEFESRYCGKTAYDRMVFALISTKGGCRGIWVYDMASFGEFLVKYEKKLRPKVSIWSRIGSWLNFNEQNE